MLGGWCLNVNLVIGFDPSLNLCTWTKGQVNQYQKLYNNFSYQSVQYHFIPKIWGTPLSAP